MNATKYTKGPWKHTSHCSYVFVNTGEGHDGVICKMPFVDSAIQWAADPASLENSANTRLIAAAPELLEAAITLLRSLEWEEKRSGTTYAGYEDLREAIRKATE